MAGYEVIVFDNDGVLVDSEPISNRVLADYLTELGHVTSYDEAVRDYMGAALHRVHETVFARSGRRLPADFDEVLHHRVFAAFERDLVPVPRVAAVLEELAAAGVPYCVASSGTHERIRVALRTTGLYGMFGEDRIFSVEDVGRGKPAPDLFLDAAGRLGFEPGRCAVVEDSVMGVEAALGAGMDVYGFAARTPAQWLGKATKVFGDMGELAALLAV